MQDDISLRAAVERLDRARESGEMIMDEGDYIARAVEQQEIDARQAATSMGAANDSDPFRTS